MSPNFIWSDDSVIKFQHALSPDNNQNYISEFNNIQMKHDQSSVDDAAKKLSNIFISAANMSLKRRFIKQNKKHKTKKWFDADLYQVRYNLMNYGKIYSRFPKDPTVKNHYDKLYREYSNLRKFKYKQYRQSLLYQLDSLPEEHPRLYWNIVNELKGNNEKNDSCAVPSSTLVSHFTKYSELNIFFF